MNDPFRIFPLATATERADLRASLSAVGLKNPVVVDEAGDVIDGHERRDGCVALGIDWMVGADVRVGLKEIQKKALAIELNLWRRPISLTRTQRNELLDIYLIANPQLSESQVADLFGLDQSTVNRRKRSLMHLHKLEPVESTVGKDGVMRKVGLRQRSPTRIVVKGKKEFESLKVDLPEVAADLHGIVRRPLTIHAAASRKRAIRVVNAAEPPMLPASIRIEHCDFRQLGLADNSIDVILTDVVWSRTSETDWRDLAELAAKWLKPDGLFCSYIGTQNLPYFCHAFMGHLNYQWTFCIQQPHGCRSKFLNIRVGWLAGVVFSKAKSCDRLLHISDTFTANPQIEKDFHDWQQSLDVSVELMDKLTRPGDLACDPHLGSGTNAVAAALLEGRQFVGCDINQQHVRTARFRVAKEGHLKSA